MAISTNPFTELLSGMNTEPRATTQNQSFKVQVVSSPIDFGTVGPNKVGTGITGAGLYALLRVAEACKNVGGYPANLINSFPAATPTIPATFTELNNLGFYYDTPSASFYIRDLQTFIGTLNAVHNNINHIIRCFVPLEGVSNTTGYAFSSSVTDTYGIAPINLASRNGFLFVRDYLFPGSYTGNTAGVLPILSTATSPPTEDLKGNGITGAFFVYDSGNLPTLSRTGLELLACLEILAYGGTVMLSPSYNSSSQANNNIERSIPVDACLVLEQGSYAEGITSASGTNRAVYGSLVESYQSGNTFNFCHGISAAQLTNAYALTVRRNNLLNSSLITDNSDVLDNAIFVHNGLSGADFSITQASANGQYSDLHRYPGFDGITSSYQNLISISGSTTYSLNDEQLTRMFCVLGEKTRYLDTVSFGNDYPTVELTVPLTVDAIGTMIRAKAQQRLFGGIAGLNLGTVLNTGTCVPFIPAGSTTVLNTLQLKRINAFVGSNEGTYLASDYVGSTGAYTSEDRLGVSSLAAEIRTRVTTLLTPLYINNNSINNPSTRVSVVNAINNAFATSPDFTAIRNAINSPQTSIVCDNTNNTNNSPTLTVDITVYPRIIQTGTGVGGPSTINALTINITIG